MSTYPMDPVDAAWYHIDGPANLAMVTAVVLTKQPLDFDRVREVYRRRLAGFDRFRQRVVETGFPLATPHWQDMPHFDIDQHLHRIALPAPHDMAALKVLFSDIASMPLDREQPLWHVHVVENVGGGSALIMRYHHCIGDGTAMQAVVRKVFDATPDAPLAGLPGDDATAAASSPADVLFGFDTLERAARGALALALGTVDAVAHPQRTLEKLDLVLGGAGVLLGELAKPADPKSPFKGDFGLRKHVAWSTPVAIADVKAIGAPLGAKINDVLVAAMTGALRAYLKGRGVDVNHTTVRAMVPVDLRPPERVGLLGNDFGLVLLDLPVAAAKAADRLAQTKARMDRLKRSPEPVAMKFLFELFGQRAEGDRGPGHVDLRQQGERGDDQRRRPERCGVPRRRAGRPDDVLGAPSGQGARHGHQHPELPRHGFAGRDCRRRPSAGPGSDHRRVQPRVPADAARREARARRCRCRRAAAHARHDANAKTTITRAASALSPTTRAVAGDAGSSAPTPALVTDGPRCRTGMREPISTAGSG